MIASACSSWAASTFLPFFLFLSQVCGYISYPRQFHFSAQSGTQPFCLITSDVLLTVLCSSSEEMKSRLSPWQQRITNVLHWIAARLKGPQSASVPSSAKDSDRQEAALRTTALLMSKCALRKRLLGRDGIVDIWLGRGYWKISSRILKFVSVKFH